MRLAGVEVEVIAADLGGGGSSWTDDVAGISVFRYKEDYPAVLMRRPVKVLEKIAYRIALFSLRRQCEGTPYDRAVRDKDAFLAIFHRRLNEFRPDVVVVSGAPFNLLHYVAQVRDVYGGVRFIGDLRDPWIGGQVYGYSMLSEKRELTERRKEREVVRAFDGIVSPWQSVVDDLRKRHHGVENKFWLLPHVWDGDDLSTEVSTLSGPDLLCGGNLYTGFGEFFSRLGDFGQKEGKTVRVYAGGSDFRPEDLPGLEVEKPIAGKDFLGLAKRSGRLLLLIPHLVKDGFTTKVLEFAATGRPVVAVGVEGSLSELIVEKGLGVFFPTEEAVNNPGRIFEDFRYHPDRAWVDGFEARKVTDGFLGVLDQPAKSEQEKE